MLDFLMAFARWANHALRIKLYYRVVTVDNAPEIDKGSNKYLRTSGRSPKRKWEKFKTFAI